MIRTKKLNNFAAKFEKSRVPLIYSSFQLSRAVAEDAREQGRISPAKSALAHARAFYNLASSFN
jgi:hypothetical protein